MGEHVNKNAGRIGFCVAWGVWFHYMPKTKRKKEIGSFRKENAKNMGIHLQMGKPAMKKKLAHIDAGALAISLLQGFGLYAPDIDSSNFTVYPSLYIFIIITNKLNKKIK